MIVAKRVWPSIPHWARLRVVGVGAMEVGQETRVHGLAPADRVIQSSSITRTRAPGWAWDQSSGMMPRAFALTMELRMPDPWAPVR